LVGIEAVVLSASYLYVNSKTLRLAASYMLCLQVNLQCIVYYKHSYCNTVRVRTDSNPGCDWHLVWMNFQWV